mmetsp:Transcript_10115/g.21736  ORF Transcript_10115/g.21736 Transcript_10115/m.21736 type:complete len:135 (-) Transcript_10115:497-901(-)
MMMMAAQYAFQQAINKDKAQQIDNDWETINDILLFAKATTTTAGFPPITTFKSAIERGAYVTWPGLNRPTATTFLRPSPFTAMGHLHMIKQGIRSTQPPGPAPEPDSHSKRHKVSFHAVPTDTMKYTITTNLPG